MAKPIYVKNKNIYPEYERFVRPANRLGLGNESLELNYPDSITVGLKLRIDSEYRINSNLEYFEIQRTRSHVNLKKENENWTGTTTLLPSVQRSFLDFSSRTVAVTLPECTDKQLNADQISLIKLENGETLTEAEYIRLKN